MKLSVLTLVTNPDERQEMWREAVSNYCKLGHEVVVVNGGKPLTYDDPKVKIVDMDWPEEWDYSEFPRHLNFGIKNCTGDWIIVLMIDHMISEREHRAFRQYLETVPKDIDLVKLSKLNFIADMMYAPKGTHAICFRNKPDIAFGFIRDFPQGDLCIPMRVEDWNPAEHPNMPIGVTMQTVASGFHFWNFNYTFRTKEVARWCFWRNTKAYRASYKSDLIGYDEASSWDAFLEMMHKKFALCNQRAGLHELPESIQDAIKNLKPEQLGYNFWGE